MLFNSPEFIFVFLPISFLAFLIAGRWSQQAAAAVVVAASVGFYAYWRADHLVLLAASIFVNYQTGARIRRFVLSGNGRAAYWCLVLGIVFNLGLIAYFKYLGFFAGILNSAVASHLDFGQIALPLGISFFTFTQITFLVDVYRQQTSESNPLRYTLFVVLFPHLIAGPILHQQVMGPQFQRGGFGRPTLDEFRAGLMFFVAGLFKKVLLADPMGSFATPIFDAAAAAGPMTLWEAWSGSLAYTLQIYFDFSGYSDMAVGLGMMFGVKLPVNFNSPYKAVSITDFWRRWHMTLSAFLRDYLYVPLGGNRNGAFNRYRNLIVTMLLGGLWHGASWNFVLWGGLHGTMIGAAHSWRHFSPPSFGVPVWLRLRLAHLLTFLVVVLAWVPFRAESMDATWRVWKAMLGVDGIELPARIAGPLGLGAGGMFANGLLDRGEFWILRTLGIGSAPLQCVVGISLLLLLCFIIPNTQEFMRYDANVDLDVPIRRTPAHHFGDHPILVGCLAAAAFWVCIFLLNRPTEFLYFNF
jgi:D-alanyl-lipoteichoic acid acyltransferase DltB (MBOAT superfamily)